MIYGQKIRLRPLEEDDLELLVQWMNDPEISHKVVGWDFPISLAEQKEWFKGSISNKKTKRWMIETLDGQKIGVTGLWDIDWQSRQALSAVKIGNTQLTGMGLGVDAIYTVMAYSFWQLGLNRLWGQIIEYNRPSYQAYVGKCGWKVEGILRQAVYRENRYFNVYSVSVLKEDFVRLERAELYKTSYNDKDIIPQNEDLSVELLKLLKE